MSISEEKDVKDLDDLVCVLLVKLNWNGNIMVYEHPYTTICNYPIVALNLDTDYQVIFENLGKIDNKLIFKRWSPKRLERWRVDALKKVTHSAIPACNGINVSAYDSLQRKKGKVESILQKFEKMALEESIV